MKTRSPLSLQKLIVEGQSFPNNFSEYFKISCFPEQDPPGVFQRLLIRQGRPQSWILKTLFRYFLCFHCLILIWGKQGGVIFVNMSLDSQIVLHFIQRSLLLHSFQRSPRWWVVLAKPWWFPSIFIRCWLHSISHSSRVSLAGLEYCVAKSNMLPDRKLSC